jgi:starch synthase
MPSKFEPCGLGQMIAMRYGTLPLVRETGGLKDTVQPYNQYTGEGTGFTFTNFDSYDLKEVMYLAIYLYNNEREIFNCMIKKAMEKDYSWKKSAAMYLELFTNLMNS